MERLIIDDKVISIYDVEVKHKINILCQVSGETSKVKWYNLGVVIEISLINTII